MNNNSYVSDWRTFSQTTDMLIGYIDYLIYKIK